METPVPETTPLNPATEEEVVFEEVETLTITIPNEALAANSGDVAYRPRHLTDKDNQKLQRNRLRLRILDCRKVHAMDGKRKWKKKKEKAKYEINRQRQLREWATEKLKEAKSKNALLDFEIQLLEKEICLLENELV